MKNLVDRFIKEEDAALDMWITVVLFLLVTIAAYIILWKNWGRQALKQAVNVVNENMGEIMTDANGSVTTPAF